MEKQNKLKEFTLVATHRGLKNVYPKNITPRAPASLQIAALNFVQVK